MQKTYMPTVAGLLNIIAGAIGILGGLLIILLISTLTSSRFMPEKGQLFFSKPAAGAIFTLYFLISITAVAGGMAALRRRLWPMALAGGICSILSIWGGILGIGSIVFLVMSKKEFSQRNDQQQNGERENQ